MNDKEGIKITISKDEYNAYMTISEDFKGEINLTDLGPLLKESGIVLGIKRDMLATIVDRYKKGAIVADIIIAEGTQPSGGVAPAVEYMFEISTKPKENESGKIDYREISKVLNVKQGQVLAIKRKLKQPTNGTTVTGKRTAFPLYEDIAVMTGGHIEKTETDDFIYYKSAMDGALVFENNMLSICPILDIQEDVDFSVGNIHFKGDVKIGRDILPDFIVEAEGNISIWGSAIACKLKSTGDIDVRSGIVGKNKGDIYADGFISATFVENSTLKSKNDIYVKNGIIGSMVHCDGILKMENSRSRIVGSTIRAAKGIIAHNVGSRFDTSTILITGVIPDKETEYNKIKEHLDARLKEAKDIETRYGRAALENKTTPPTFSNKAREDFNRWDILKSEIQRIFQRLKQTEEEMYDYESVIKIKESLYPRVVLKIGKYSITTTSESTNVTIRYSKDDDRLIIGK